MQAQTAATLRVKERLVRAALELLRKQGLPDTTPREIARVSGVSLRHFYYHFKNKQGIARAVLHHCLEAIENGSAPINCDVRCWRDLNRWFLDQAEYQQGGGMMRSCLFATIATALTEDDEAIRQDLSVIFALIAHKLASFFAQEKARRRISAAANPVEIADLCVAAAQGALLVGKITQDSDRVFSAIDLSMHCIEALAAGRIPHQRKSPPSRSVQGEPTLFDIEDGLETVLEARHKMIAVAKDLFHKQGAAATSPDEIIERARTGKGQFYYHFGSKQGLIHEVLQDRLREISSNSSSANCHIRSWTDLERWFVYNIEMQKQSGMKRGCLLGTIGDETNGSDALLQQDLKLIFEVIHNKLAAFFIREKAAGVLGNDRDENALANFCIATLQGAMLIGKVRRDAKGVETVVRQVLAYVRRDVSATSLSDAERANFADHGQHRKTIHVSAEGR